MVHSNPNRHRRDRENAPDFCTTFLHKTGFKASDVDTSTFAADAGTATPMPERAKSVRVCCCKLAVLGLSVDVFALH